MEAGERASVLQSERRRQRLAEVRILFPITNSILTAHVTDSISTVLSRANLFINRFLDNQTLTGNLV